MKCESCGAEIRKGSRFCECCGTQITVKMLKEQETLNKSGCPHCYSTNVSFNREKRGEITDRHGTRSVYSTIGVCMDCGCTWRVSSEEDQIPPKKRTWLWVLGWIFVFPLPLTIILLRPTVKVNVKIKYAIIAIAWLVYVVWLYTSDQDDNVANDGNRYTTIETSAEVVESKSIANEQSSTGIDEKQQPIESKENTEVIGIDEEDSAESEIQKESAEIEVIDSNPVVGEVDPDLKAFLDSYESFMIQYCELLKSVDSGDMKAVLQYYKLIAKYVDFATKIDDYNSTEMSEADSAYYFEVLTRVNHTLFQTVTERPQKNGFDSKTNSKYQLGDYTVEVPSYWEDERKIPGGVQRYAETGGKVAMLELHSSYDWDLSYSVTFDGLMADNDEMIKSLESTVFSKIIDYEVIDTGKVKGILYKGASKSELGISGYAEYFEFASESDRNWCSILCIYSDNTEYMYSGDLRKMIESITIKNNMLGMK